MVQDFGLGEWEPLARLATIVRGADTDRVKIAPEAAGLLALSLGLSRMFDDDHAQLEAGMLAYDAFTAGAAMPTTRRIIGLRTGPGAGRQVGRKSSGFISETIGSFDSQHGR
jgi:hypothetical protein